MKNFIYRKKMRDKMIHENFKCISRHANGLKVILKKIFLQFSFIRKRDIQQTWKWQIIIFYKFHGLNYTCTGDIINLIKQF